jgi:hypothetical protein
MNSDDLTLTAKVALLETTQSETTERVVKNEASIEQLNRSISMGIRMTIWQFLGFTLVMAGTLLGSMYWAAGMLERRLEQFEKTMIQRIEQSEQHTNERINQLEKNTNERINQVERNLTSRFEDLRQVVLSKRQVSLQKGSTSKMMVEHTEK